MPSQKERICDSVALELMFTLLMQSGIIFLKWNAFPVDHCWKKVYGNFGRMLDAIQESNDS